MHSFFALLSFGTAWLTRSVIAYGIDNSCTDQRFIQLSADAAVQMAADALVAIRPPNNAARDANVERLLDLLFRPTVPVTDQASDNELIGKIAEVFAGVAKFGTHVGPVQANGLPATANEVNIFCGLNRVSKRNDGVYFDSSTGVVLENFDDHELNSCHTGTIDLAITWAPFFDANSGNYLPSQVTICPWFYEWAHTQELRQWGDLSAKAAIAEVAIPAATNIWPFTPIDAITLLDKVLLHEFTHTHACGVLVDVEMTEGGAPGLGKAYGWKAATNLAKQADGNMQKAPQRNSDSFALFASGVRLLALQPPVYIKDSGWVTKTLPTKRDVPLELQYKRTPAAFEGFVTRIRAEHAAATAVEHF